MLQFLTGLALASSLLGPPAVSAERTTGASNHSLFVWAGDRDNKGNDFLLVIDADPRSPNFGRRVTSLETDQKTVRPHYTEYAMPASGMLFANDHDAGRCPLHQQSASTAFLAWRGSGLTSHSRVNGTYLSRSDVSLLIMG